MSLPLLAAMVAGGVGLIVALIHFTGGSRVAELADADAARTRFLQDFPAEAPRAIFLSSDRHAAFLDLGRGRVGLVHAVGGRFLTRLLRPADLASLRRSDAVVQLRLADFTFAGGSYTFADVPQAQAVEAMLAGQATESRAA